MKLWLWSNNENFAKEHGFHLSKKDGEYYKTVSIPSATKFYVIKELFIPKKEFDGKGFYAKGAKSTPTDVLAQSGVNLHF